MWLLFTNKQNVSAEFCYNQSQALGMQLSLQLQAVSGPSETLTGVPSPGLGMPFLGGSGLQAGSEVLLAPLPSPVLGICWANWRHRHSEHGASRKASSFWKTRNAVLFVVSTANLAHTGSAVGMQNKYTARISYTIRKRPKSAAYPNTEVSTWPTLPCQRKRSLLLEVKKHPWIFPVSFVIRHQLHENC